ALGRAPGWGPARLSRGFKRPTATATSSVAPNATALRNMGAPPSADLCASSALFPFPGWQMHEDSSRAKRTRGRNSLRPLVCWIQESDLRHLSAILRRRDRFRGGERHVHAGPCGDCDLLRLDHLAAVGGPAGGDLVVEVAAGRERGGLV